MLCPAGRRVPAGALKPEAGAGARPAAELSGAAFDRLTPEHLDTAYATMLRG